MPCYVRNDGLFLEGGLAIFRSYTDRTRVNGGILWDASASHSREPTDTQLARYQQLKCDGNVTCFSRDETAHPINFYEQTDVCQSCGAERFRTTNVRLCCQEGELCFNDELCNAMPTQLIDLISMTPGLSKQSRTANELFRFAQFALPKGTHRMPDSFKHLKVTGIPYAIVPNVNEASSTRSFLDEPYERLATRDNTFAKEIRPSDHAMVVVDAVLRAENPLAKLSNLSNLSKLSNLSNLSSAVAPPPE